jgi:MoxR-like ATPase
MGVTVDHAKYSTQVNLAKLAGEFQNTELEMREALWFWNEDQNGRPVDERLSFDSWVKRLLAEDSAGALATIQRDAATEKERLEELLAEARKGRDSAEETVAILKQFGGTGAAGPGAEEIEPLPEDILTALQWAGEFTSEVETALAVHKIDEGAAILSKREKTLLEDLAASHLLGQNVYLEGQAGTGKTFLAKLLATKAQQPLAYIPVHGQTTAEDLLGGLRLTPCGNGEVETSWQDGPFVWGCRIGALVLIDDLPYLPQDVGGLLLPAIERETRTLLIPATGETVEVNPETRFVATGNPVGDSGYTGLVDQNVALLSRFSQRRDVPAPTVATETKVILSKVSGQKKRRHTISPDEAKGIAEVAALARKARAQSEIQYPWGFRESISWAEMWAFFGDRDRAFSATVAEGAGADSTFLEDLVKAKFLSQNVAAPPAQEEAIQ